MIRLVPIGGVCDGVAAEQIAEAVAAGWQVDECNGDGTYRLSTCYAATPFLKLIPQNVDMPAIVEKKGV